MEYMLRFFNYVEHDLPRNPLFRPKTYETYANVNGPVKEMQATDEEMNKALVPYCYRDYCAHKYIDILKCYRENLPFHTQCGKEFQAWHECQYYEEVHRRKQLERAKRIMKYEKEKEEKN